MAFWRLTSIFGRFWRLARHVKILAHSPASGIRHLTDRAKTEQSELTKV